VSRNTRRSAGSSRASRSRRRSLPSLETASISRRRLRFSLSGAAERLVQQRLHRVEPDLVVGNGDLVAAGAAAVLAADRRPKLLVRACRRLDQDTPDVVETFGRRLGETSAAASTGACTCRFRRAGRCSPRFTASAPCSSATALWCWQNFIPLSATERHCYCREASRHSKGVRPCLNCGALVRGPPECTRVRAAKNNLRLPDCVDAVRASSTRQSTRGVIAS
jgi:hypothetical protein